ncbi:CHAP domain-containing protein [Nannocystis pusilla]|uniref:CHAP domain-containing protein n=1 Tax=Nannocystis pusilla TaxID=889268 RepID=A0A9X3ER63_9BACT|nr:CHAP domain-containing protein [Nannocystis pusilla]MCY1008356.1 CHAP domain-containing protein [Nannocystis pusilla]
MTRSTSRLTITRCGSAALAGLVAGAAGSAAAADKDKFCQDRCPDIPLADKTWTQKTAGVQCVEYANYRSGLGHGGHAYTWAAKSECSATPEKDGVTCVQLDPEPGTIVVSKIGENGAKDYGHVAVVECVAGDWAKVSEYNYYNVGAYSGDRCINVREAKDLGTPYLFLRPNGKTFAPWGEKCDAALTIKHALIQPDAADVRNGKVDLEIITSPCSRAEFTLHREVYKNTLGQRQKLIQHSWSKKVKDVLDIYKDSFAGVEPCSEFVYTLERKILSGQGAGLVTKSAPMTGVNLEPPTHLTADYVDNAYGQIVLRWKSACPNYVGPKPTQYELVYSRGAGAASQPKQYPGTVIAAGVQDREHKVTNLFDASDYLFSLRTFNHGDRSATAAEVTKTTKGKNNTVPPPMPQRPLLSERCQEGQLAATWNAATGADSYELEITGPTKAGKIPAPTYHKTTGTSFNLPAPDEGTYKVRLRSYQGTKAGLWTETLAFARDCVAEPPILSPLVNDDCVGVKLAWTPDPAATAAHLKEYEVKRLDPEEVAGARHPAGDSARLQRHRGPARQEIHLYRACALSDALRQDHALAGGAADPSRAAEQPAAQPRDREDHGPGRQGHRGVHRPRRQRDRLPRQALDHQRDRRAGAVPPRRQGRHRLAVCDRSQRPAQRGRLLSLPDLRLQGRLQGQRHHLLAADRHRRMRAPINLAVKADPKGGGTLVTWGDAVQKTTSFDLYRKRLTDATWQKLTSVAGNVFSYVDKESVDAQYYVKALHVADRTTSEGPAAAPVTYLRQKLAECPKTTAKPELTRVTNVDDPRRSKLEFTAAAALFAVTRVESFDVAKSGPWTVLHETSAAAGPVDVDVSALMNKHVKLRLVGVDRTNNCLSKPSAALDVYPLPTPLPLPTVPAPKDCAQGLMVKWIDTSTFGTKFQVEWKPHYAAPWQPMTKDNYFRVGKEVWQCHTPFPADAGNTYRVRSTYQVKNKQGQMELLSASRWTTDIVDDDPADNVLTLDNGTMEAIKPGGQAGDRIIGWVAQGAWAEHKGDHVRPNNGGLGLRFGYYAAASESVSQNTPFTFEAGKTYVFKGWVNGGGDGTGKVPLQIGWFTDPNNLATFKPLASETFNAKHEWAQVAGASFKVPPGHAAVGQRIAVRLGSGADGGASDIWFDNLTLSVK